MSIAPKIIIFIGIEPSSSPVFSLRPKNRALVVIHIQVSLIVTKRVGFDFRNLVTSELVSEMVDLLFSHSLDSLKKYKQTKQAIIMVCRNLGILLSKLTTNQIGSFS